MFAQILQVFCKCVAFYFQYGWSKLCRWQNPKGMASLLNTVFLVLKQGGTALLNLVCIAVHSSAAGLWLLTSLHLTNLSGLWNSRTTPHQKIEDMVLPIKHKGFIGVWKKFWQLCPTFATICMTWEMEIPRSEVISYFLKCFQQKGWNVITWENIGITGKATWLYMLSNHRFLISWTKLFILLD